jgi:moderate conductance mechanosensitive channel
MRRIRHLLLHLAYVAVCTILSVPAAAQMLPNLPQPSVSGSAGAVPGLQQQGLFLTAPVTIDGAQVFRIATLVGGGESIAERILIVEGAIAQVLTQQPDGTTMYSPRSFKIVVQIEDGQETLAVMDAHHSAPLPIVTVTNVDAQYARLPAKIVAEQWQAALQPALIAALQRREPGHIRSSTHSVVLSSIVLASVTLLAFIILWFGRRYSSIRRATEATLWVLGVAWTAHVIWALLLFPQTSAWGNQALHAVWQIIGIWITAFLVNLLIGLLISRFTYAYARRGRGDDRARHMLRAPTIAGALDGFKRFIVLFVAALATLSALQIPIASVVTIGGIAAVAVGFASQSLVRDFVNGMLVLFEDQYVVGDYVMIGEYNGIVENLSLRIVQIRDARGNLITIPHSSVSQVVNASRDWSRIDYRVAIDPAADVTSAIATLRSTIDALANDEAWQDAILDAAEWIGVETIGKGGIVLRASIRTAPMRQFDIRRVLNERVLAAFASASIAIGNDPLAPAAPTSNASPDPT